MGLGRMMAVVTGIINATRKILGNVKNNQGGIYPKVKYPVTRILVNKVSYHIQLGILID